MTRPDAPAVHPVILKTGPEYKRLPVRERVRYLSRLARKALVISARHLGATLEPADFRKDDQGAPLPVDGIFWSISHKPAYVAAVAALDPAGIDVERLVPRADGLWERVTDADERALLPDRSLSSFFRCWTAKEAVLKAAGVGLTGLSQCRIAAVPDDLHLDLIYDGQRRRVAHFYHDDHLFSVVSPHWKPHWDVRMDLGRH